MMIYLMLINAAALAAFGIDKYRAIHDQWRISERRLMALAVAGGSVGAYAGMKLFHHKTLKGRFRYGVPAVMVVQAAVAIYLGIRII